MSGQPLKVTQLLSQAADRGSAATPDSLHGLHDLGRAIQGAMGVSADDIPASEVFLLSFVIDDSGSIRFGSNTQHVRDGHNAVQEELRKSSKGEDILVHAHALNSGVIYPFCPLKTAPQLDTKNYNPDGDTPLFDATLTVLGAVIAKEQEFANQGVPVRSVTVIVSDGANNTSLKTAADVRKLVDQLLKAENHIVALLGVDDGSTDYRAVAAEMGIRPEWVLTPQSDGKSIRHAFGVISRISQSASQGAASFSKAAATGFGSGIT